VITRDYITFVITFCSPAAKILVDLDIWQQLRNLVLYIILYKLEKFYAC